MLRCLHIPGRNAPCPCGSGRKFKRCCWAKFQTPTATQTLKAWAARLGGQNSSLAVPSTTAGITQALEKSDADTSQLASAPGTA